MQTIQVIQNGDIYSCDIGISKEEWLEILQDERTPEAYIKTVLRFFYYPAHRGSCTAVCNVMGGKPQSLNVYIKSFGEYVQKRLGRFQVVRPNGKPCYWIVPMCEGKDLPAGSEGSFEWELRPELLEAIREYLYWYLVECYKDLRREVSLRDEEQNWDELYKWELITASRGKTPWEVVKASVDYPNDTTKGGFKNLIYPTGYGKSMKYLVENKPKELRDILMLLADEKRVLNTRLEGFKDAMQKMLPKEGYSSKANDERTAATILTCLNPDNYTFYKHDAMYDRFCRYLGEDMKKAGECYEHYLSLLKPLAEIADNDKELHNIVDPMLEGLRHSKLLLAQDVLWMLIREKPKCLGYIYDLLFSEKNNSNDMKTMNKYDEYIELLKANHNLILTGAPGTGKTHLAKEIANEMNAEWKFVQFHPSYDYSDFVEGLRPVSDSNGNVGFERRDGVFKAFCAKAQTSDIGKPYVFIIDEINRGEISKIFGELFFSIDPGYRGERGRVQTQYQNMVADDDVFKKGFLVPENVYIIGTMNDIDRSVESMDFAMRRRFAWKEVTAEDSMAMLDSHEVLTGAPVDKIKSRMRNLNKAILETEGLGEAYQIGAAYFLKYAQYAEADQPFDCLWEYHLKGLLFEYLRGNRNAKEQLELLHKAYQNENIADEQPADTNEG